jgi:NADPH:quinone reductase-like Zn-dependent oxidoreductase
MRLTHTWPALSWLLQILKAVGFKTIITTSSPGALERLSKLGATHTLTYSDPQSTADRVLCLLAETAHKHVPLIVDCVGDAETLQPVSKVSGEGSKVAVLVPLRMGGHGKTEKLLDDADVAKVVPWYKGVEIVCVKSFSYAERVRPPSRFFFGARSLLAEPLTPL